MWTGIAKEGSQETQHHMKNRGGNTWRDIKLQQTHHGSIHILHISLHRPLRIQDSTGTIEFIDTTNTNSVQSPRISKKIMYKGCLWSYHLLLSRCMNLAITKLIFSVLWKLAHFGHSMDVMKNDKACGRPFSLSSLAKRKCFWLILKNLS
jgi:hypothetical protein